MRVVVLHTLPSSLGKVSCNPTRKEETELDWSGEGDASTTILDCFLDASVQREVQLNALLISFNRTRAASSIRPCGVIGDTRGVFSKQSNIFITEETCYVGSSLRQIAVPRSWFL
jgi:hypothetical protein